MLENHPPITERIRSVNIHWTLLFQMRVYQEVLQFLMEECGGYLNFFHSTTDSYPLQSLGGNKRCTRILDHCNFLAVVLCSLGSSFQPEKIVMVIILSFFTFTNNEMKIVYLCTYQDLVYWNTIARFLASGNMAHFFNDILTGENVPLPTSVWNQRLHVEYEGLIISYQHTTGSNNYCGI